MESRARVNEWEDFTMLIHGEMRKLWPLVRERRLMPLDLCVVQYLASHMDIRTGRIEVRTKDIGDDLGVCARLLTPSLKRLREECLLAKGLKGTGYYWMLNPHVWHVGGQRTHGKRVAAFQELCD